MQLCTLSYPVLLLFSSCKKFRNRNIPKVGYPTLNVFAEFVTDFDMPSGPSATKKDMTITETGRPFSPAMIEGVLKNSTPDVPNSISRRPRLYLVELVVDSEGKD